MTQPETTVDESSLASTKLLEVLRTHRDRDFLFVTPGGNWGDDLIYHGMHRLAAAAAINYRTVDHDTFMAMPIPANTAVYIHGSGGYVPWWGQTPVHQLHKAATTPGAVAILGPSSYDTDPKYLDETLGKTIRQRKCDDLHVFAREQVSFDAIAKVIGDADAGVHLDHDTAINLTRDAILELADVEPNTSGGYHLLSQRVDHEQIDELRHDLRFICIDPVFYADSFSHWVRLHEGARVVVANRLHSAILSTLLGKRVTVMPNSWHKNRGVWEHSLKQRGAGWCDQPPQGILTRLIDCVPPLSRAARGQRGRNLRMKLAGFTG